ncbi:MAG: hypothetical protein WA705_26000, partial [Candidatus Ozemobacteraceae bacterium]
VSFRQTFLNNPWERGNTRIENEAGRRRIYPLLPAHQLPISSQQLAVLRQGNPLGWQAKSVIHRQRANDPSGKFPDEKMLR